MYVLPQTIKVEFTTGGYDNIYNNPSSTTTTSALHGIRISFQPNFDTHSQQTENLIDIIDLDKTGRKQVKPLFSGYTSMDLDISVLYVPVLHTDCHPRPAARPHIHIIEDEYQW